MGKFSSDASKLLRNLLAVEKILEQLVIVLLECVLF